MKNLAFIYCFNKTHGTLSVASPPLPCLCFPCTIVVVNLLIYTPTHKLCLLKVWLYWASNLIPHFSMAVQRNVGTSQQSQGLSHESWIFWWCLEIWIYFPCSVACRALLHHACHLSQASDKLKYKIHKKKTWQSTNFFMLNF